MVRRRWPDVVVVAGIVAVFVTGVWAIWGEDLKAWWSPPTKETEKVEHHGDFT